jgi:hypothetical protein
MNRNPRILGVQLRFWRELVHAADNPTADGCWEWNAGRVPAGYGTVKIGGKNRMTHRVAYEVLVGRIPPGMEVCHECDNPPCINPDHLWIGTHADNMRDMRLKRAHAHPPTVDRRVPPVNQTNRPLTDQTEQSDD